jgi:hypothetical protein
MLAKPKYIRSCRSEPGGLEPQEESTREYRSKTAQPLLPRNKRLIQSLHQLINQTQLLSL